MIRLMMGFAAALAVLAAPLYSGEWSRNNVLKYVAGPEENTSRMLDYENIRISPVHLRASAPTNAWLITQPVFVGENHLLASAFLNLDDDAAGPTAGALLSVRDSTDDHVIREQIFTRSGRMDLPDVFNRNVYLRLDLLDTNAAVLSYGLVRQPEIILTSEDLRVSPAVLFYDENILRIHFALRYPAVLDVILFDRSGRIVETIVKQEFFSEGENYLYWEPPAAKDLASGSHLIYFKVRATDGKIVERTREFLFVRN